VEECATPRNADSVIVKTKGREKGMTSFSRDVPEAAPLRALSGHTNVKLRKLKLHVTRYT